MDVIVAVARKSTTSVTINYEGAAAETRRLLCPSTFMKIGRLWRLRRFRELVGQ